ncbi:MAG TPA: hypothetical protein VFB12_17405 [Ktedonobacteraceae bacterium]|nr:hypothetical protein [Ktedonobacteraceae bacterium]
MRDDVIPVRALADHYAEQLEKAGWARTDEGQSGPLAWHAWKFQDDAQESWQGQFFVMKIQGSERRYFSYIRIEMSDQDESVRGNRRSRMPPSRS